MAETSATITIEIPGKESHSLKVTIPETEPSNEEVNDLAFLLTMMVKDAYPTAEELELRKLELENANG